MTDFPLRKQHRLRNNADTGSDILPGSRFLNLAEAMEPSLLHNVGSSGCYA